MIYLTGEEQRRFAAYLEQEAARAESIVSQMDAQPGDPPGATRHRREAMACRILLRKLADEDGG